VATQGEKNEKKKAMYKVRVKFKYNVVISLKEIDFM
jgi:hypothetical protein